jgi:hypothetical protein
MNRAANRSSRPGGALLAAAVLVSGGVATWRATQHPPVRPFSSTKQVGTIQSGKQALTQRDYVSELVRQGTDEAIKKLVACYVIWAGTRDTLDARQAILDALFQLESLPRRLDATLQAIAEDPTSPEDDPLWSRAVDKMSQTWQDNEDRLPQAQEVMLLESRPRARRLMATAMAQLARSGLAKRLSEARRLALAQDLIDLYLGDQAQAYRYELEPAIRSLSGDDVALLLREGPEGVKLDEMGILVRRDHAVQQAARDLASK